jgi:hypothetical protein
MAPTAVSAVSHFQVQLSGEWKNYVGQEDLILKRAFMAGFPHAKYTLRRRRYQADFKRMIQKNLETGKERQIRPPCSWNGKAPSKPVVEAGPTFCVKVPEGAPGTTILVPHPKIKGRFISVSVPATARTGQTMLVPVPALVEEQPTPPEAPSPPLAPLPAGAGPAPAAAAAATADGKKKGGWSTGAKVAAGLGVAGAAVGGVVLGAHIAEEGWDETMADLGDVAADAGEAIGAAAEDAGEAIVDAAEDAGEWIAGAAEDAGDFIMDLF